MKASLHIDCRAIAQNYHNLCNMAPRTRIGAVIKANAYGLGMALIAPKLFQEGCRLFIVANEDEALSLREVISSLEVPIWVLGSIDPRFLEEADRLNIIPVLNSLPDIEKASEWARQSTRKLSACIHIDTGMNRLGLSARETEALKSAHAHWLDGINVRSWISHFVCSEDFESDLTTIQRGRFLKALQGLPDAPKSLCNSSGLFWGADYQFDIARPGIALYGGNPTPGRPNLMANVVELFAPIVQIHEAAEGETVGYNATYRCSRPTRIATIPVGYADGYHRSLSGKGFAIVAGHRVPVIGRVSMDLVTLDITQVPEQQVAVGDNAMLIGQGLPVDEVSQHGGTISYEILTSLGSRFDRVYTD